jgi:hypothetical protein
VTLSDLAAELARQTTRGSTIEAGGDVSLRSGQDLTVQASRVAAGGDIALEADGRVALLSGTDTAFRQYKGSRKSAVWQSAQTPARPARPW